MTFGKDPRNADQAQPSPTLQSRLKFALASLASAFASPMVRITGIACLAVLLIAAAIAFTVSRHNGANRQNASTVNPQLPLAETHSIAKPSPIHRAEPSSSPLPSAPAAHLPVPAIVPQPAPAAPSLQYHAAVVPPPVVPP